MLSDRRRARSAAPRYGMIDAVRGFAAVNMIVFHLLYDLFCVYSLRPDFGTHTPELVWEQCIGITFILVSGISLNFSRRGYRRGGIVLLGGLLITLLTLIFIPSELIWFGVLHFLGCAILITFTLRKALDRIDPAAGALASLLLFAVLYGLPYGFLGFFEAQVVSLPAALYRSPYLAFLGLPPQSFFSADYFPLLPWLFLFLFGYFLWRIIAARGWDRHLTRSIPGLSFIGRHSFVIYLLHQPVLFGLFYSIFGHF